MNGLFPAGATAARFALTCILWMTAVWTILSPVRYAGPMSFDLHVLNGWICAALSALSLGIGQIGGWRPGRLALELLTLCVLCLLISRIRLASLPDWQELELLGYWLPQDSEVRVVRTWSLLTGAAAVLAAGLWAWPKPVARIGFCCLVLAAALWWLVGW